MTPFRFFPFAAAVFAASSLIGCNTTPTMPMGSASAQGMGAPGQTDKMGAMDMGKMDAQMKKMREMHDRMAAARTPDERNKLMAEHMKTMQDGMQMMGGMGGTGSPGMGDMKDMPAHHSMMARRMAMMESMMQMMMDRMPTPLAR
jgi:hypothetical protein